MLLQQLLLQQLLPQQLLLQHLLHILRAMWARPPASAREEPGAHIRPGSRGPTVAAATVVLADTDTDDFLHQAHLMFC